MQPVPLKLPHKLKLLLVVSQAKVDEALNLNHQWHIATNPPSSHCGWRAQRSLDLYCLVRQRSSHFHALSDFCS